MEKSKRIVVAAMFSIVVSLGLVLIAAALAGAR